ncbi:MAG: DUF3343 domain-containing protein [Atopobiaceae bacterium]
MALIKKPALVISFSTTTSALAAESFFHEHGYPGRIIPLPREISAGCGLSWKAEPEDEERLCDALRHAGIEYDQTRIVTI